MPNSTGPDAAGIIAEYNPFHNGHEYMLRETKRRLGENVPLVALMSGYFTQRGEAAIFGKWERARWAIDSGINLVLELPTVFAVRSAQDFASGAIQLFAKLGLIKYVAFGAENDDITWLSSLAQAVERPYVIASLKKRLKTGTSYASALEKAVAPDNPSAASDTDLNGESGFKAPNNILAIQYLRAINACTPKGKMIPLALKRQGAAHRDAEISRPKTEAVKENEPLFSSATAIRQAIAAISPDEETAGGEKDYPFLFASLPKIVWPDLSVRLKSGEWADTKRLISPVMAKLIPLNQKEIAAFSGIGEGMENLIWAALRKPQYIGWEDFLKALKSKRYPYTRLSRLLVAVLLGLTREKIAAFDALGPAYARILAFDEMGRALLQAMKKTSQIPLIDKTSDFLPHLARRSGNLSPAQEMLHIDLTAAEMWRLSLPPAISRKYPAEQQRIPYYKKISQPEI